MSTATARRRYNRIRQLYVDGDFTSDRFKLQHHIVDFYKTFFIEEHIVRPALEEIKFDKISSTEATFLDEMFSEEEVFKAIK